MQIGINLCSSGRERFIKASLEWLYNINLIQSFRCAEAFAVCENYSPPEGFNEKDLYRLLEQVGSPSGAEDLGNFDVQMLVL